MIIVTFVDIMLYLNEVDRLAVDYFRLKDVANTLFFKKDRNSRIIIIVKVLYISSKSEVS
jgi:hypothetical protein